MFQVSVVNRSHTVPDLELHRVVRAVNRQIKEDFEPYWGFGGMLRVEGPARGSIDTRSLRELRGDAILYLVDYGTADDVLGYHEKNLRGVPYGFVYLDLCAQLGDPWSVTLSHEALELIADPQANLLVLGPNPKGGSPARVYHWFELCDAVQTQTYQIDEVTVSNFVLPSYYAPGDGGARTNFIGTPLAPFQACPGGYIGYFEPGTDEPRQFFGDTSTARRRFEIKNAAALPVGAQPSGRNQRRAPNQPGAEVELAVPAAADADADADPIRHVVVLMLENRSFDHVLGGLKKAIPDLDGVNPAKPAENVDATTLKTYKQLPIAKDRVSHCFKVPHEHADVVQQLANGGKHFVDSFVTNNPHASEDERKQVMAYFKDGDLPVTHALAKNYLVCNRWFSSLPGPTWPNRFFVHSGTSLGNVVMPSLHEPCSIEQVWGKFTQPTIYDRLEAAGISWRIYHDGFPQSIVLDRLKGPFHDGRYAPIDDFIEHARDEKSFPAYVFIEPRFLGGFLCKENDQHAPTGMLDGERLVASVYNAIRSNDELWRSTLFVLTYDEHGGFYDHVTPPEAIAPDDSPSTFAFDRLGVRVPTILISPWLPAGCDDTVYDHTSILRYLIQKHGLPPLGARTDPADGKGTVGFASSFLESPRADGNVQPPFVLDEAGRRGAMAGREPFEPDESQRLLLALAEQLRRHDQTRRLGETLPSVPSHAPAMIPSDAYRFARRIDNIDEWLRTRGASSASAAGRPRRHGGSPVHGMSAGPAVQPDGLKGIDVWAGTGQVDWREVKESGIDFVYVRAAYGTHPDKFAVDYLKGARAAGLVCGVYHFLRTSEDYRQQIAVMTRQLELLEVGKGDLPPALDVEDNPHFDGPWNQANKDNYLTALAFWIKEVRTKTGGAPPVLYTRAGFWEQLGNPAGFGDCPLWVASYGRAEPKLPTGWPDYHLWQYSESGHVPGIAGLADLNCFPGTLAQLQALTLR